MTDEIRFLGDMQRLTLKPGDILVLTSQQSMNDQTVTRLREMLEHNFPGHKCLVLSDDLKLGVLEKAA